MQAPVVEEQIAGSNSETAKGNTAMPKTLAQFKTEFVKHQKAVEIGCQQQKKNSIVLDRAREMFNQGAMAVGQRVQELKDGGHDGKALKDFLFDREVKELNDAVQKILADIEKEMERAKSETKGALRKIVYDYDEFLKEMGDEIDRLVKAKSGDAIGLSTFLKECKRYREQQSDFFAFVRDGGARVNVKGLQAILEGEVAKTKISRESMLNRQKLNPRNLMGGFNHAKELRDGIVKQMEKVKQGRAEGDAVMVNTSVKVAAMYKEKFNEIVTGYGKAYAEFRDQVAKDPKDGPTITRIVTQMLTWKKDIEKDYRTSAPV
jgi:hypothetical protein